MHSVVLVDTIAIAMSYLLNLNYCTAITISHCAILIRLIVANIIHSVSVIFITFYLFTRDDAIAVMMIIRVVY